MPKLQINTQTSDNERFMRFENSFSSVCDFARFARGSKSSLPNIASPWARHAPQRGDDMQ